MREGVCVFAAEPQILMEPSYIIQYAKPNCRCSIPAAQAVREAGRGWFLKRLLAACRFPRERREGGGFGSGVNEDFVAVGNVVFVVVLPLQVFPFLRNDDESNERCLGYRPSSVYLLIGR